MYFSTRLENLQRRLTRNLITLADIEGIVEKIDKLAVEIPEFTNRMTAFESKAAPLTKAYEESY